MTWLLRSTICYKPVLSTIAGVYMYCWSKPEAASIGYYPKVTEHMKVTGEYHSHNSLLITV